MFEHGTPGHKLVNKLTIEKIRIGHFIKECEKIQCENIGGILTGLKKIIEAIDAYTREMK